MLLKRFLLKLKRFVLLPIRKVQYASFGSKSDIINPMLISGKANMYIGNHTIIKNFARIEAISRYHESKFSPKLIFGNRVNIEQGVHITCTGKLEIGENTVISSYVYISDTAHGYSLSGVNVLDQKLVTKNVSIGRFVFIGTGVKILPGVTIGNNSIIGANAVVTQNIPDNVIAVGVPAKVIKRYDSKKKQWITVETRPDT